MYLNLNDINKIIEDKFTSSFMNDSKWNKLIESLTDEFGGFFINYKLIYREEVRSTSFMMSDFKPFFIEPILYKEVEWIEFPERYQLIVNKKTTRMFIKEYNQDVNLIEKIINKTGEFMTEKMSTGLKLYAYW